MSGAPAFSAAELADCAARELRQRHRVYDRLVAEGRMTRAAQRREIAMMAEIERHFRALSAGERLL